jgi:predicted transcriptional regulator
MKKKNRDEIIALFKINNDSYAPKKVATLTNIKESTVRSILSRLAREGVLISNADGLKGYYKLNPASQNLPDGVNYCDENIRFQNIVATINLDKDIDFKEEIKEYPNNSNPYWKIKKSYGHTHKKITINMSGKAGFEPLSVLITTDFIIQEINKKYNLNLDVNKVIFTLEAFKDFFKIRLPTNNITYEVLTQWSLKIYNKRFGVRYEEKTFLEIPYDILLHSINNPILLNYSNNMTLIKNDVAELKTIYKFLINQQATLKKEVIELKDMLNVLF